MDPRVPREVFENVAGWIEGLLGSGVMGKSIVDLIGTSYVRCDSLFCEADAVEWAEGFAVPPEMVESGAAMFCESGFDFAGMVAKQKESLACGRISSESVKLMISDDNPEKLKMLDLVRGMQLFVEESFQPNGLSRPAVSRTYRRVQSAVNKMLCEDFVKGGLAVIIPGELVERHLKLFHVSRLSWAPKAGKAKGRPILDCSAGVQSLNSDFTKKACDERWGSISHPTIGDLVRMILAYWRASGAEWDDLVLWKVDLRGAYTLLSFEDEAVRFVGAEMTGGLFIFFLCGVFGWSGTPASFQVVSRALKFEILKRIRGAADLYVDDIFGVSRRQDVQGDIAAVVDLCRQLFQSDCIETSKTEIGRRVVVIGYVIDLDLRVVSVAERNLLKVIYGLCALDFRKKISVKVMQRFASWISRYSAICQVLKPLSRAIYQSFAGRRDHVWYDLGDAAVRAIQVFRALFLVAMDQEKRFTRSLSSFDEEFPTVVVEFDASLGGGGVLWFGVSHALEEQFLGSSAFDFAGLEFSKGSDFQNSSEFLAAMLGLIGVLVLCKPPFRVKFRGDSKAALAWLVSGRIKSDRSALAAFLYGSICLQYNVQVVGGEFTPGVENVSADGLSRGRTSEEVRATDHRMTSNTTLFIPAKKIFELCYPLRKNLSDAQFIHFWKSLGPVVEDTVAHSVVVL